MLAKADNSICSGSHRWSRSTRAETELLGSVRIESVHVLSSRKTQSSTRQKSRRACRLPCPGPIYAVTVFVPGSNTTSRPLPLPPLFSKLNTRSSHLSDTVVEILQMEVLAVLLNIASLISDACQNVEKLPAALISTGVVQAAAALALAIFKAPGGIFLHHGKAFLYLYYGILIAVVTFGLVEAYVGFYVSGNLTDRRAIGKTILWISILPIVLVAGLGGFVILQ
ncbi:hypothetical protein ACP70R_010325 [Stipagrostis hirtigluma subsp. patula]